MLASQDISTLRTWSDVIFSAKEFGKVTISFAFLNNALVSLLVFMIQGLWIVLLTILLIFEFTIVWYFSALAEK